jgi:hypothetical protein
MVNSYFDSVNKGLILMHSNTWLYLSWELCLFSVVHEAVSFLSTILLLLHWYYSVSSKYKVVPTSGIFISFQVHLMSLSCTFNAIKNAVSRILVVTTMQTETETTHTCMQLHLINNWSRWAHIVWAIIFRVSWCPLVLPLCPKSTKS